MAPGNDNFNHSGPSHLTGPNCVDWNNPHYRRSVVACLVQGVYTLELDRQEKRKGTQALAPPWWESFHFQLHQKLINKTDSSIIGAVFEYKPPSSLVNHSATRPHFVVAFRGNLIKLGSVFGDFKADSDLVMQQLSSNARFEIAMQVVQKMVTTPGCKRVWLAGHCLGAAIALQAGKNMAREEHRLESFLFNPLHPYPQMANNKLMGVFQSTIGWVKAAAAAYTRSLQQMNQSANSFADLSEWVPLLFVNKADPLCSAYIGEFERQKTTRDTGAGYVQKAVGTVQWFASLFSTKALLTTGNGHQEEPPHLIPSANLTINSSPPQDFEIAHGICQWWKHDQNLRSEVYEYN